MKFTSVTSIIFSPTGTTKKITKQIVKGISPKTHQQIDLTRKEERDDMKTAINGELVIIAVPVYEEKIPALIIPYLNQLKGRKKPVVLVCVYGNIGEGIVLSQLKSIALQRDFKPIALASFVGEHSFSSEKAPLSKNRPDDNDLATATSFGKAISDKLKNNDIDDIKDVEIPINKLPFIAKLPIENSAKVVTAKPDVNINLCNQCGLCARLCPTNAINHQSLAINHTLCIRCFSCVKHCQKKARSITYRPAFIVKKVLHKQNQNQKSPVIYI